MEIFLSNAVLEKIYLHLPQAAHIYLSYFFFVKSSLSVGIDLLILALQIFFSANKSTYMSINTVF